MRKQLAHLIRTALLSVCVFAIALPASSQNADSILINGKILYSRHELFDSRSDRHTRQQNHGGGKQRGN